MWVHSFRIHTLRGSDGARGTGTLSLLDAALRVLGDEPLVTSIAPVALERLCARSRDGLLRPGAANFDAILEEVFALAWSGQRPPAAACQPRACHPAALRAARLLRETDSSISMAALARRSALSRERLSRVFAQCHGIGLVQYRNHHLVQRFIHEYGHGSCANMLRAALDVGFGSYAQFHRAFKQVTGYPPATHLERVRDGIVDPARTG
jgi:AraC-like DNA-binding protein